MSKEVRDTTAPISEHLLPTWTLVRKMRTDAENKGVTFCFLIVPHHTRAILLNEVSDGHKERLPVWSIPRTFELVKDAVIFIERTQLTPKVIMDLFQRKLLVILKIKQNTEFHNQPPTLCCYLPRSLSKYAAQIGRFAEGTVFKLYRSYLYFSTSQLTRRYRITADGRHEAYLPQQAADHPPSTDLFPGWVIFSVPA